ncbi:hypothetical protein AB6A40_009681 [Gnathostoma spinigerum]|uniref:Carboxylesterase type B domain-containing protein n=1 Tax=Gnathostoma spinigerum TaxID=75299 RepID=A0ABD6F197_9BILA
MCTKLSLFLLLFLFLNISLVENLNTIEGPNADSIRVLSSGAALQGRKMTASGGRRTIVFLGIPYAEAPVGDRRYKAPVTRGAWKGILDATKYKVSCLQNSSKISPTSDTTFMSEDCLHINVFATARCLDLGGCPVLVILRNGEYSYDPTISENIDDIVNQWVIDEIIVVTFNYRLGSFGFINFGPDTSADENVGLLDQIEALKWVQREIGRFGGDFARVTLYGEGMGAINVDQLLLSPQTANLFQQAILLDGAAMSLMNIREDTNLAASHRLAKWAGCASVDGWNATNLENSIECLRKSEAAKLLAIQRQMEDSNKLESFKSPSIDGPMLSSVFPERIPAMLSKRRPVRIMTGTCTDKSRWLKDIFRPNRDDPTPQKSTPLCRLGIRFRQLNATEELLKACEERYKKGYPC